MRGTEAMAFCGVNTMAGLFASRLQAEKLLQKSGEGSSLLTLPRMCLPWSQLPQRDQGRYLCLPV